MGDRTRSHRPPGGPTMATDAPTAARTAAPTARRRPRRPLPALPAPRPASTADALSLSRAGEVGATVDLAGPRRPGDPRRDRRPGPARPAPRHRPRRRAARPGPPPPRCRRPSRRRRPAPARSARSPAAAWAPCSRAATRTSAATWPSRSSCDDHRDDPDLVRRFVEEAADRRPAPAPRHRADLRAGHLRRPPPATSP